MAVSICGAVDLLAAIFNRDKNLLRIVYGLPTIKPMYRCLECNKLTKYKSFCSRKCKTNYSIITVICSECGQSFQEIKSQLIARVKRHKIDQIFCSKQCYGRWLGRTYGYGGRHMAVSKTAHEIQDKFCKWADNWIADIHVTPSLSPEHRIRLNAKIDTLQWAKNALIRIIKEVKDEGS